MILKVKVEGTLYTVEVGDLKSRPIFVSVDGETFEVWPESKTAYSAGPAQQRPVHKTERNTAASQFPKPKSVSGSAGEDEDSLNPAEVVNKKAIRAPLPGVITTILVQPGSEVSIGQELCKLEAMKMNNSIRASKSGRIASIHISIGETVKHNELLMDYEEE
jgi:glutaconyl-CoA/methylmalonyl-CoA decarboxylase subunit gamma